MSYYISICTDPKQVRKAYPESAPWDGSITPRVTAEDGASVAMVWLDDDDVAKQAERFAPVLMLYPTRVEAAKAWPDLVDEIRAVSTISNSDMDELP